MSYLVDTTNLKKKFCIHDYHLRYKQGSNDPYSVCIRCGDKRRAVVTEHNEIRYTFPSKRSVFKSFLEHFDEMQESPNWLSIRHDSWDLPGRNEPHHWCASWYSKGCLEVEKHSHHPQAKGKGFLKRRQRFCYRASCERCQLKWMYREANTAAKKLEKYEKKMRKKAKHIVVRVPWWEQSRPIKELRRKAYSILKELKSVGGLLIPHPYKTEKSSKMLYPSLHFHGIGFGWLEGSSELYNKNGWQVFSLGPRDSIFATVVYQLSHAGIRKGRQTLTWFGNLSYYAYSKLNIEKEPKIEELCPACQSKIRVIYYRGQDTPPPDVRMEMFVDPAGWYYLEPIGKTGVTKIERYEYARNQELYFANKGISVTS